MRKIIPILIALAMVCSVLPVLAIDNDGNQAYNPNPDQNPVTTIATINGGTGGGGSGNGGGDPNDPIIKVKWEYDMDVDNYNYDADPTHHWGCQYHDAAKWVDHLQVAPVIGGTVTVGYYAVVTSPLGVDPNPAGLGYISTYDDIWHPDGQFKYQIQLQVVGWDGNTYSKTAALDAWDHVTSQHDDLIMVNAIWEDLLPFGTSWSDDVYDELNEGLALLYYTEAEISYCQPGGHYYVGATAFDKLGNQAQYLYNSYWYIPTSAVEIDFNAVDYSPVHVGTHKVVGGDQDMNTATKPTARNIGNTPIQLSVQQNDMQFGQTGPVWNVHFDARMGANGQYVYYDPMQTVVIPGTLPLCTQEKLDFSILVDKAVTGYTYTGWMKIWAYIDWGMYTWNTPSGFVGTAPYPIPQNYNGPMDPWGDDLPS